MAGPSQEVKLKYASKDTSHDVEESWSDLFRNFIMCLVLGATVWAMCTGLKYSVEQSTDFLFEHFKYEKIHHGHVKPSEDESKKVADLPVEGHEEKSPEESTEESTEEVAGKEEDSSWHEKVSNLASTESPKKEVSSTPESEASEPKKVIFSGAWQGIKEISEKKENAVWVLLIVMFLGALIRAILMCIPIWKSSEGDGATQSIEYFLKSYSAENDAKAVADRYEKATFMEAIRRSFITLLTLGAGGSGGLEGPTIPVGEAVGAGWSKVFKVQSADDLRCFQMAGIAAAACTLINTPFAAAIFAAEVVYSQRIVYRTLLYSMISVICAYALNNAFGKVEALFPPTPHSMNYTIKEYLEVAAVSVFASAPTGLGLKYIFGIMKNMFNKIPFITRAPIGALLTGLIGLGTYYYLHIDIDHVLGMGENTVHDLINNHGNPELKIWWVLFAIVLLKCLTTGLTLMAGGSAGLLVPSMVLGGASGAGMFYLIQELGLGFLVTKDINLFIISGVAAALVAVVQVPVAAILIVTEMFGANFAPPAMISVVICHLMVKRLKGYNKPEDKALPKVEANQERISEKKDVKKEDE